MQAQTFMEHLTDNSADQGAVSVVQDPRLDAIVNGNKKLPSVSRNSSLPVGVQTGNRVKASGFRIQVFWGGSTRADEANAQRAGLKVTTLFPELTAYTAFISPNWSCRVGDFSTRAEANIYLQKLKEERIVQNANIVRSEVYVYQ